MTASTGPADPKRKWYGLALRHLRMASRLLGQGFADGGAFHAYHCYECVLSALIAARGYAVPPEGRMTFTSPSGRTIRAYLSPSGRIEELSAHRARILFFDELADRTRTYYATHQVLRRFLAVAARNDALYYDVVADPLPQQRYPAAFVAHALPIVRQFAREIWQDIR